MAAEQYMVQPLLGSDNSTKGKKLETTIHHTKQPQLSVGVFMTESLNEEIELKLSSLSVYCLLFVAARSSRYLPRTEKISDPWICVLWGPLTECDWQNGCCMRRMRAAVDISDRGGVRPKRVL